MDRHTKDTLMFITHELVDKNKFETLIDDLDFEVRNVNLIFGFGFSMDKLYIDLDKLHDRPELALYVFLHEVGHMTRFKQVVGLFEFVQTTKDFEAYFSTVLEEEEFADEFAKAKFEGLVGREISGYVLADSPDIYDDSYKNAMNIVFNQYLKFGSWDAFINTQIINKNLDI